MYPLRRPPGLDVSVHQLGYAGVENVEVVVRWMRVDTQRDAEGLAQELVVISVTVIQEPHAHVGDHLASLAAHVLLHLVCLPNHSSASQSLTAHRSALP